MIKLPATRVEVEALIPHRGSMCLLDRVLAFDQQGLHAQADSHRSPDHPLREGAALAAVHLCEYGAQAMAVHGGLCAAQAGQRAAAGWLVSLRGVELHCDRIEQIAEPLDVHVEDVVDSGSGWQSRFRIEAQGRLLASGRCAVIKDPGEAA
ncbi:phosphotransferase [Pseudomarimonas arenosa]|uniref:Phosphotransferase n=1 Tax=Pseudomarimonas arenosa TaxID=2774145 RepID=A0AAW3ZM79_9GAMM|nr:phosphotransferase [Pseudomarimonas arenosa]MBD8525411.1 phosphotransferase [Pseudomarimonas arenosa]